jgi:hypothetical protein
MRTGIGLTFICLGAILAFAVTGTPSFLNLHTAGWVIMIIGLIGLVLPRRTYGWLGRRMLVRRTYPEGRVEQVPVPPYVTRNPGTQRMAAGLPPRPTLDDQDGGLMGDPAQAHRRPAQGSTEVIEDLYEQP